MRIYLDSVGCRLNWSEVEMLARQLIATGHTVVTTPEEADIIVINTCAVTAQAERKTRHTVRSLHRDNPDAQLAVIGCYPTLRPEVSAGFPSVSWVIPNAQKGHTADRIAAERPSRAVERADEGFERAHDGEDMETLRTRAFVKVQDGCDNHCTYCIIRSLRGPSRSRPLNDVIAEIQMLTQRANCREAVLTGASLGAYGRDLGRPGDGSTKPIGLDTLIRAILAGTDLARLRLSSLEPWDIDETFFELWDDPRLCRQIHLPLQAGCDATLRRMGRPITTDAFAQLVEAARIAIPDVAITTDVLVGFPGEDEEAFRESYAFVRDMAFAKLHVFPYSPRPGTPATRLPGQVPRGVRDKRAQQVRKLGAEQRRRFQARFVNRELAVLWEKQWKDGRWTGWTDNYIRVVAAAEDARGCQSLVNQITPTRLLALKSGYLTGDVIR
jgi:threonylcarbamoyladenosine tRNA methylthiotransferase MtaB